MTELGNIARAEATIAAAIARGVRTWCIAPGGRNAPFVAALDRARGVDVLTHFEERAAAFFALGRARRNGEPVAVVTTSGTAAAELLPAAIEARHAGVPLLLITADRPHRLRHSGAPQAIEQAGLLAPYAPTRLDSDSSEPIVFPPLDPIGPVHLNIAFDEPLLDAPPGGIDAATIEPVTSAAASATDLAGLDAVLSRAKRPFLAIGGLLPADVDAARAFALALRAPLHADPTSQLRTDPALASLRLEGGGASVRDALRNADAVIRIGAVPVSRFWRDLDHSGETRPIVSIARAPYPGLERGEIICVDSLAALSALEVGASSWGDLRPLFDADRERSHRIERILDEHPHSEPALVRALSRLPSGFVFLGNSLPIREWSAFATRERSPRHTDASRGANGIDGQLSTFFGGCRPDEESWAVLGDLTTLYDLAAPWVLDHIRPGPVRIAIINNGGGRIFDRLFGDVALSNAHSRRFDAWASMWSLAHERYTALPDTIDLPTRAVLEIVPDPEQTDAFWRARAEATR